GVGGLGGGGAAEKGGGLREGAEGGEAPRRRDGNSGASAGAIASNLSRGTRNCRWTCRHGSAYGNRMTRTGYRLTMNALVAAISARCKFIASVLQAGMIRAAPLPSFGQTAPKM